MKHRKLSMFMGCLAATLFAGLSSAATINVPGDQATIQAAVNAAATGDVIVVHPGTYVENIVVNKNVTIRSINPSNSLVVAATIVDGNAAASVFRLAQGPVIDGLTITNGNAMGSFPQNEGGAVYFGGGSTATVRNCVLSANTAQYGGGIQSRGSNTLVKNCTIVANTAFQGAGIFSDGGSITVENCQFIGNNSTGPGLERGAFTCRSTANVIDSSFTANVGGGFETTGNGTPMAMLDGCMFTANTPFGIRHGSGTQAMIVQYTSVCNNTPDNVTGNPIIEFGGNNLTGCHFADVNREDECCNALPISHGSTSFSTIGARGLMQLPPECDKGETYIIADIWYQYIPQQTGMLTVSTCGAVDYDSRLAAWSGDCDNKVLLGCNDDACGTASSMTVSVIAGENILIQVGGKAIPRGIQSGSGTLTLTFEASCPADLTNSVGGEPDGIVNVFDLFILLSSWGNCP